MFVKFWDPHEAPAPGTGPHANFQAPYEFIELWTPGRGPRRPDLHSRVCLTLQRYLKKNCRIVSAEVVLLAVVDKRELAHSVSKINKYFLSTLVSCKENEMVFVSQ